MTELTAKKRNALPDSAFAGADRSYPVNDKAHAANAKARATQQEAKGNLTPAQHAKIDAKANAVLGQGKAPAKKAPVAKKPSTAPSKSHDQRVRVQARLARMLK